MDTITITETGCYLDNHRGHYLTRDVIELAVGYGFIIGPFEQFAVSMYDSAEDAATRYDFKHRGIEYPHEALIELADEARDWLNSGQSNCVRCHGTGKTTSTENYWIDQEGVKRCKECTGTGRGPRVKFQNFPPIVPEGHAWDWNDGDFGIYSIEDLSD